MKPINKDAKLLIRSYIDNIEDYLKSKSKMHPNIIDGVLNEINDFVYLRSTELAEDKIVFANVLRAIDECGSPSDICEQYLEDDVFDGRNVISNKIVNDKSKSSSEGKMKETSKTAHVDPSSSALRPPMNYLDQLQYYPKFGFYRTCFLFLYLSLFLILISSTVQSYQVNIPLRNIHFLCDNFFYVIFFTFILLLLEVGLLGDWKNKNEIEGFSRTQDDRIVILISRLTILIVLLKASLLPLPEYFFISFPFLFVLLIWMERQHSSDLWTTKISPNLNNLARSVETGRFLAYIKDSLNSWLRFINSRSSLEKVFLILSALYFVFSLFFPWYYGWDPLFFPLELFLEPVSSSFKFDRLLIGIILNFWLLFVLILGGIIVSNVSLRAADEEDSKLIPVNIWIIRLSVIRTFLMITTYGYGFFDLRTAFLLLIFLFLFEISLNRVQNKIVMQSIVNGLKYLGSEKKPYIPPETDFSPIVKSKAFDVENQNTAVTQPGAVTQGRQESNGASSRIIHDAPVPIIDKKSPIVRITLVVFLGIGRSIKKFTSLCIRMLYMIFKPVYTFSKALVMALVLLCMSILEVLLFIFAILTQLGTDGSYVVPVFTFDWNLHPYNESIYSIGGFVIWSWFILGILATQIFILVVVQWYQYARKRNDGIIVIFFRNICRILLVIVALGSIYQGWWYYDTYASLRIFAVIILAIFMEISSLKIRLERRQWQVTATNSKPEIEQAESVVPSPTE